MLRALLLLGLAALGAAEVEEVRDEKTFKKILSSHPAVAVDFFSHTCGPCIMIAPKFKALAAEYDGKVKFVKVDVQSSYVGVQVRSMPTFHFYVQGKLEHQFSGADENGMRQSVAQIARKAEEMDIELSLGALEAFYQKHDPSKLNGVDEIYEKYPAYKLVAILKKKYGEAPEFTKKTPAKKAAADGGGKGGAAGDKGVVDIRKMDLDDLKAEVYRREAASDEKEMELIAKKNARRREKVVQQCSEEGGGKAVKLACRDVEACQAPRCHAAFSSGWRAPTP